MTEKPTFREALHEAADAAVHAYKYEMGDIRMNLARAFLKSLEAQGATILWGGRTESMVNAAIATFGKDDDRTSTEMTIDCCDAYVEAAPTVTDLIGDER